MIIIDISKAKKDFVEQASTCVNCDEIFNIKSKHGGVILLSEKNYNSLIESLYLAGIKGIYQDIEKIVKTPTSNFSKKSPLD